MRKRLYRRYSVYLRDSKTPVMLHGTAKECAKACSITLNTFYGYLSKFNSEKNYRLKYSIYEHGKPMLEEKTPLYQIPDFYKVVILSMAENDMVISKTAMALKKPRNAISYAVKAIKADIGKNPENFYDLCELLKMVKGGVSDG